MYIKLLLVAVSLAVLTDESQSHTKVFENKMMAIRGDRGGQIYRYALKAKKWVRSGGHMHFSNRCDSACTLYLSMPRKNMCITQGASFGFHLPYGLSQRDNRVAAQYMMKKYPRWVRRWIVSNGGLNKKVKRMNYAYASRYIPHCPAAK